MKTHLTLEKIKEINKLLFQNGRSFSCKEKREGEPIFIPKPKANQKEGYVYKDGSKLVTQEGILGIFIEPGIHGRAYAAIDLETGEIYCCKCKSE